MRGSISLQVKLKKSKSWILIVGLTLTVVLMLMRDLAGLPFGRSIFIAIALAIFVFG